MGKALYRKYRSKSLDDVVGQNHITETLKKALKNGRIRHAYLFSGPKGVGKTSVARILAHEINQLPYTDDSAHLDIIEIDAASNRRIDEIRDLRDKVHIAPTSAKFKVYVIDEVHMLTREAFNALLKTLEEPPEHVVFILATTEAHKLPETIVSRTQHFTFKPVSREELTKHLATIAKSEKTKADPEALELLADYGQGSVRDSLSLFDQLSADKSTVSANDVRELVGMPQSELLESLLNAVRARQPKPLLELLNEIDKTGANPGLVAKMLGQMLRTKIAAGEGWGLDLLKSLVEVPSSSDPRQMLEIALLEETGTGTPSVDVVLPEVPAATESPHEEEIVDEPIANEAVTTTDIPASTSVREFDDSVWKSILDDAKSNAPGIYSALRLAKPSLSDDELTLAFEFPLHQKKIAAAQNLSLVGDMVTKATGHNYVISTTVTMAAKDGNTPKDNPSVDSISNIFGGAEVLES